MSVQRPSFGARWAALSGADRVAAGLWIALALLLLAIAAGAALHSDSHTTSARKAARIAPAAIARAPSVPGATAPVNTLPAVAAATVTAAATATASAATATAAAVAATPAPPRTAADVPDAALLPAGATLVRRANLAGANGGTIVAYWQTATAGGCAQPRIVVLQSGGGPWRALWDTGAIVNGTEPLLPVATLSGDRCFPQIGLFAVQPLDSSGTPYLTFSVTAADGSTRIVSQPLANPEASQPATAAIPPGAAISLGDGLPAVLQLSLPVYAPDGAGLDVLNGQPIGREDELLSWQNGGFQPSGRSFALSCLAGSVLGARASAAGVAIALRCPDGAAAAVAVTPATQIAANLLVGGLQPGDDLSVALLSADPPVCQSGCTALPTAAQVDSRAAAARQAPAPPAAPQPAAPAATSAAPLAAPARAAVPVAAPQTRPAPVAPVATVFVPAVESAPEPVQADTNPTADATVVAPARPIPVQPAYVAPRPIPTQGP